MQDEVAFVQKDLDSEGKNGKRVNAVGKEQCHHFRNNDGHWIYECPDISLDNRDNIKKYRAGRWAKKNGHNHIQFG